MHGYDDEFFLYPGVQGPIVPLDTPDRLGLDNFSVTVPFEDPAESDHAYIESFFFVDFGIIAAPSNAELAATANEPPIFEDEFYEIPESFFGPLNDNGVDFTFGSVVVGNPAPEIELGPEYLDYGRSPFVDQALPETDWITPTDVPIFEELHAQQDQYVYPWEEIIPAPPTPLDPADGIPTHETTIVTIEQVLDDCLSGVQEHEMQFFFGSSGRVFAVSDLNVFNIAFMELGLPPANSLADTSHHVKRVVAIWPNFRRAFLQDHPWNGAKKTIQLNKRVETPVARWDYMYDIPTDFIQALSINGHQLQDGNDLWEVETTPDGLNKVIMTDANEVFLEYIFDPVEVGILAPMVLEAMGLALAAKVAGAFGKKATERTQLTRRAQEAARQTRSNDSREGIPRFFSNEDLVDFSDDPRNRFPTQGI